MEREYTPEYAKKNKRYDEGKVKRGEIYVLIQTEATYAATVERDKQCCLDLGMLVSHLYVCTWHKGKKVKN